ncbi:CDP-glycerol glycerophosphotransferase family protein [Mammaliicoccus lentus]|uniref:CDP-glycerol glycerophosphotransferase family protein n=1 Tax=Mammaliicoccus lentus TaxID=42858 RepID=UPI001FFEB99C|nr:CDP-glycerol glycerophosphotransferase family protein [Mammaliicoccus lentus]WGZ42832.1 CDP-glycerol glycerophosphotransferase family protein [Mammaliicoccus lentus]
MILTGLARFDNVLKNRGNSIVNEESLLIMPTWRKDQDLLSKDKFLETDFYNIYNSLLKNHEFISFCKNKNIKINFYLHKNFQKFSSLFNNEHVNIIREEECSVSRLLETNKVLITDYSSVALDFALMHKKVVYYRPKGLFTEETFNENAKLLPGRIVEDVTELIVELKSLEFNSEFKENLDNIYLYEDTKACYRIVQEMLKKFKI